MIKKNNIKIVVLVNCIHGFTQIAIDSYIKSVGDVNKINISYSGQNDDHFLWLIRRYKNVVRNPSATCISHMQYLFKQFVEEDYDFLMLLHDDDYIEGNYLEDIFYNVDLKSNKNYTSQEGIIKRGSKYKFRVEKLAGEASHYLLYIMYFLNRHYVCFPNIIYCDKTIQKLNFNERFGKYDDIGIVEQVILHGLEFIPIEGFFYRIHSGQDSAQRDACNVSLKRKYLKNRIFKNFLKYLSIKCIFIIYAKMVKRKIS